MEIPQRNRFEELEISQSLSLSVSKLLEYRRKTFPTSFSVGFPCPVYSYKRGKNGNGRGEFPGGEPPNEP